MADNLDNMSAAVRLEQARERIASWRKEHGKRARMPESLWEEAADLTFEFGINRVRSILSVNRDSLKNRIRPKAATNKKATLLPAFVEVSNGAVLESIPATVVEVTDSQGMVLKISISGALDIAGVVTAFRRANR